MNEQPQRYCYSWDNKSFNSGTFDSIDDALSDALKARNENDLQSPQQFVYIADAKGFDNRAFYPDADTIIEHMACNADDVGGEHADCYPDADATAEAELTQKLHELLDQWCAKHQISPTFYHAGKGVKYDLEQIDN